MLLESLSRSNVSLSFARPFRRGVYFVLLLQVYYLWPLKSFIFHKPENWQKHPLIFDTLLSFPKDDFLILLSILLILGIYKNHFLIKAIIYVLVLHFHFELSHIVDGGDALLDIFCLFLCFISEDKKSQTKNIITNTVIFMARIQLCLVYLMAAIGKLASWPWIHGKALQYVFLNPSLSHSWAKPLLEFPTLLVAGNYLTLVFQMSFPFLIWNKKIRPYLLLIGTLIHLQIAWLMGLMTFGLTMIVAYFLFHEGGKNAHA